MKKTIPVFLLLFSSLIANSQTLSFKDTVAKTEASISLDDIIVHNWFYNKSGKADLKWVRTQNNIPLSWESAVCDNVQCYGPTQSEAFFSLANNDSFEFSFHFYPNSAKGSGNMMVCVYSVADSTIKTCGTFSVVGWGAGIEFLTNTLSVFPNPSDKVLYLNGNIVNSGVVKIFDITGKIVLQEPLSGSSNQINVAEIPAGCYTISVQNAKGLIHQKILIQR